MSGTGQSGGSTKYLKAPRHVLGPIQPIGYRRDMLRWVFQRIIYVCFHGRTFLKARDWQTGRNMISKGCYA